jgi:hypothetical protein
MPQDSSLKDRPAAAAAVTVLVATVAFSLADGRYAAQRRVEPPLVIAPSEASELRDAVAASPAPAAAAAAVARLAAAPAQRAVSLASLTPRPVVALIDRAAVLSAPDLDASRPSTLAPKGERANALALALHAGVPVEQIETLRESGLGWGQIAGELGTTLGAARQAMSRPLPPASPAAASRVSASLTRAVRRAERRDRGPKK